ncbi:MAG TPA: SprT-like domain-containing protein [Gemmatimonadales bacterium]|nr:SprT-like domain-containing protein [Gemmatimonadales bacterium]
MNELLAHRFKVLGLRDVDRILTHTNRTVMVSLTARRVLRLHEGYASAPDRVLRAIVRFLNPRLPRAVRRAAEREFLGFPVEAYAPPPVRPARREQPRPGDVLLLQRLVTLHQRLNERHFGGALGALPIRLSGRMRTRLGELAMDLRTGRPTEIAISRRHILRHPWTEVEHTLLHEMVHQWQAESGLAVDHRAGFRRKAAEVGIEPGARRRVARRDGAEAADVSRATPPAPPPPYFPGSREEA